MTLDALTGVVFADDSQVVVLSGGKFWCDLDEPSGARITIGYEEAP